MAIPIATASWVIPLITGGIGLLGVLTGTVLGGVMESRQIRERDKRGLCVAARLIYDELSSTHALLLAMHEGDNLNGFPLPTAEWGERRADIAAPDVDIEDFKQLTIAYAIVDRVNLQREGVGTEEDEVAEFLKLLEGKVRPSVAKAARIAAKYAGDDSIASGVS